MEKGDRRVLSDKLIYSRGWEGDVVYKDFSANLGVAFIGLHVREKVAYRPIFYVHEVLCYRGLNKSIKAEP